MGAHRDAEMFALDDARQYGYQRGDDMRLDSIADSLGVGAEVIDGLGYELDITRRVDRLEAIAQSVGDLLQASIRELEAVQSEYPEEVATFIISDQLPALDADHGYSYFNNTNVYQLGVNTENEVEVKTELWGGPMYGPYSFGEVFPLTAEWINERLALRGVERGSDFCERVVAEVTAQVIANSEEEGAGA